MNRTLQRVLGLVVMGVVGCSGLGGCMVGQHVPQPEGTVVVSNSEYSVDRLFTDPRGATVYRFWDSGDWRYYVDGPDGSHMLPTTTHVCGGG